MVDRSLYTQQGNSKDGPPTELPLTAVAGFAQPEVDVLRFLRPPSIPSLQFSSQYLVPATNLPPSLPQFSTGGNASPVIPSTPVPFAPEPSLPASSAAPATAAVAEVGGSILARALGFIGLMLYPSSLADGTLNSPEAQEQMRRNREGERKVAGYGQDENGCSHKVYSDGTRVIEGCGENDTPSQPLMDGYQTSPNMPTLPASQTPTVAKTGADGSTGPPSSGKVITPTSGSKEQGENAERLPQGDKPETKVQPPSETPVARPQAGSPTTSPEDRKQQELKELLGGENSTTRAEIAEHHNSTYKNDPMRPSELLPALVRMSKDEKFKTTSADDIVLQLLEPDKEAVRVLHSSIIANRQDISNQQKQELESQRLAIEGKKVSALVGELGKQLASENFQLDPSVIEGKVRKKMSEPAERSGKPNKSRLEIDSVVDKDLAVDVTKPIFKSIAFELKQENKPQAVTSSTATTPAPVGGPAVKVPGAPGITVSPTAAVPPIRPMINGFSGLPDNAEYWKNYDKLPASDNRIFTDWNHKYGPSWDVDKQFRTWGNRLDFTDRQKAGGPDIKGEDVAKSTFEAIKRQLPVGVPELSAYDSAVATSETGEKYANGFLYSVDPSTVYEHGGRKFAVVIYVRTHTAHRSDHLKPPTAEVGRVISEVYEDQKTGALKPTFTDFASFQRTSKVPQDQRGQQVIVGSDTVRNLSDLLRGVQNIGGNPTADAIASLFKGATLTTDSSGHKMLIQGGKVLAQEQGVSGHETIWLDRTVYKTLESLYSPKLPSDEKALLESIIRARHQIIDIAKAPSP